MPPNYVNFFLHISTLFYQSFSIISPSGRKVIKVEKMAKVFFNTYLCDDEKGNYTSFPLKFKTRR